LHTRVASGKYITAGEVRGPLTLTNHYLPEMPHTGAVTKCKENQLCTHKTNPQLRKKI
jgi:hypothetical protein